MMTTMDPQRLRRLLRRRRLETGCYLDNHRGHYILRDMVELAVSHGYIIGTFERYALDHYDEHGDFPHEGLIELADHALAWFNSGRDNRMPGQNLPPIIPDGTAWNWNDGDFGLYAMDELI